MKFTLLSIGKTKQDFVISGLDLYIKRISRYCKFENIEIQVPSKNKTSSIIDSTKYECSLLESKLKKTDYVIILDEKGHRFSSLKFANFIQHIMNTESRNIVFVIGGAHGFTDEFKKLASSTISFSDFTFPHQLMRLIFCEQLYRAMTIIKNEPYHHE